MRHPLDMDEDSYIDDSSIPPLSNDILLERSLFWGIFHFHRSLERESEIETERKTYPFSNIIRGRQWEKGIERERERDLVREGNRSICTIPYRGQKEKPKDFIRKRQIHCQRSSEKRQKGKETEWYRKRERDRDL